MHSKRIGKTKHRKIEPALLSRSVITILLAVGFGFAITKLDNGMYCPKVGITTPGTYAEPVVEHNRTIVENIEVKPYMLHQGQSRIPLETIIAFYALEEDTLLCSVRETLKIPTAQRKDLAIHLKREYEVKSKVTLCLN